MAFAAGVFTAAALNKAKIAMSEMFNTGFAYGHLNQEAPIFNGLAQRQQLRLNGPASVLMDGRQCQGIDVAWLNSCDLDVSTSPLDCDLDGDELGALGKTYVPNATFGKSMKVHDKQCKDIFEYTEKVAIALATIRASLDQELERRWIAHLIALADDWDAVPPSVENLPFGCIDPVDPSIWIIEAADITADNFVQFGILLSNLNMVSPVMVDGSNFYTLLQLAKARNVSSNGGCCNVDSLLSTIPMISNIKVVDQESGVATSFLVDSSTVGYFNTVIHDNSSPRAVGDAQGSTVWSIPSQRLSWRNGNTISPVRYDIKSQYICVTAHDYASVFAGEHRGAFISGATNCNEENGVRRIQLGVCA